MTLQAGAIIDEVYEVGRAIGAGGMATVYEATELESQDTVAIKVIELTEHDAQAVKKRFFNELALATRVRHPAIVKVHDFGVLPSGNPYIVMERLHGHTMRHYIKTTGALDPKRAGTLFLGALDALRMAHDRGVVHKDLKPGNLFLCRPETEDEALVILDFGIAHRVRGTLHSAGQFIGTPQYSAPEYLLGQVVSSRVDVYQLGLALVESLIGRPVVQSRDLQECALIHCEGRLQIPAHVLDGPLGEVVKGALATDPDERFADAGVFHERLATALADVEEQDPPEPESRHAAPPNRWSTAALAGFGAACVALGALGVLAMWVVVEGVRWTS